jgi:hypothetical protein
MPRTPIEKAVDEVQTELAMARSRDYDAASWELFIGNQMQKILNAIADTETDKAEKEWSRPLP